MSISVGTNFKKIHLRLYETLILALNFMNFEVLMSVIWLLTLFCVCAVFQGFSSAEYSARFFSLDRHSTTKDRAPKWF